MRRRLAVILSCLMLMFISYINIQFRMKMASIEMFPSDYLSQIRSVAAQSFGSPLVTFTNNAQKHFVKSFICNLRSLEDSALTSQLVVVVADTETYSDLRQFNQDITVVLKPFNSSNTNLTYGTDSYEDYIEYRYDSVLVLGWDFLVQNQHSPGDSQLRDLSGVDRQ